MITAAHAGIVASQPKNERSTHKTKSSAPATTGAPMIQPNSLPRVRSDSLTDQSFARLFQEKTVRTGKKSAPPTIIQSRHFSKVRFPNARIPTSRTEAPRKIRNCVHFSRRVSVGGDGRPSVCAESFMTCSLCQQRVPNYNGTSQSLPQSERVAASGTRAERNGLQPSHRGCDGERP
jgi:hypothetical protein